MNTLTLTVTETATGATVVIASPNTLPDTCAVTARQSTVITLGDVEITISRRAQGAPADTEPEVGYIDPAIDAQLRAL